MNIELQIIILGALLLISVIYNLSLTFRLGYWKQKAINRMVKEDLILAKKSGDGFFSFLR
jgi:hypothetical protein